MPDTVANSLHLDEDGPRGWGRAWRLALLVAVGLYAAARLWRLTASCLWFDEIFGLHAARHTWPELFRFVAADVVHPPLFYALLKVWTAVGGESILWVRLFPALTAIACVVPFLLLCRELRLRASETTLALVLLAVNGYLIKYAQEVRMYSLLLLLTLFSLWLFARLYNCSAETKISKTLIALTVVNLLLVYTHYYGWLVIATEIVFLTARRRRILPRFALSAALVALCFAPWVLAVTRSTERGRGIEQNIGWVKQPTSLDAAQFMALLHEPFYFQQSSEERSYTRWSAPLGFIIFLLPLAALLWRRGRQDSEGATKAEIDKLPNWLFLLLLFSFLPIILAFALSRLLPQSVWGTRHLIIVAAPYLILVALSLWRLRPRWLKAVLLVVLVGWVAVGASVIFRRPGSPYIWCAWERHAERVEHAEPAGAEKITVYAFEDIVAYHLWFTLDPRFEVVAVKNLPGLAVKEDPAYFLPRAFHDVQTGDLSIIGGEHFWIAFRDMTWDESRAPLKNLKEAGYTVEKVDEFDAQGQKAFIASVRRR